MADVFQTAEGISDEIVARLQRITVALGAETDAGVRVFRGRRVPSDDLIPCTVIIEGTDQVVGQQGWFAQFQQQYLIYAYVPCDPANPNVAAHKALRDLKRAIFQTDGKPDWTWRGRVRRVTYQGKDIGPRADGAAFVLAVLDVAIEYAENLAQP